ncbi:MAG: nuclease [Elusimicrobia bacterium]|nr:MAG: nuclease [Elusimicrobiota bacterium]
MTMRIIELNLESLDRKYERLSVCRPVAQRRLLASLGEVGQQSPVIVIAGAEAGRYIVIDGHKRVSALKRLKADVAKATVWELPEAQALATAFQMGSSWRRDAFEEGWLVAELHRNFKWSLGEVAERLTRSKSWASKRLALVEELPDWLAEEVAGGRVGAHAAANFLVPLTRVNASDGRRLAEKIRGLGLTNRQMGELYGSYRAAGVAVRRRIVDEPGLFLRARAAAKEALVDGVLDEKQRQCLRNLELIGNVSLGLARSLPSAVSSDTATAARERLQPAWERARRRWDELSKTAAAVFEAGQGSVGKAGLAEVANAE